MTLAIYPNYFLLLLQKYTVATTKYEAFINLSYVHKNVYIKKYVMV